MLAVVVAAVDKQIMDFLHTALMPTLRLAFLAVTALYGLVGFRKVNGQWLLVVLQSEPLVWFAHLAGYLIGSIFMEALFHSVAIAKAL
jgi:hypothetical protein